jgi:hypothetical protein
MQISEHLVGMSFAKKVDGVQIHMCVEEGHGVRGVQGMGADFQRFKTEEAEPMIATEVHKVVVISGHHKMSNIVDKVRTQGCVTRCIVVLKVPDSGTYSFDHTETRMATAAVANLLAPGAILLCSEHKQDKVSSHRKTLMRLAS